MKTAYLSAMLGVVFAGLPTATLAAAPDPTGGKFTIEEAVKGLPGKGTLTANIETSMGTFHCELFEQNAEHRRQLRRSGARSATVSQSLDRRGGKRSRFTTGFSFHRVIPSFMIKGGDIRAMAPAGLATALPTKRTHHIPSIAAAYVPWPTEAPTPADRSSSSPRHRSLR